MRGTSFVSGAGIPAHLQVYLIYIVLFLVNAINFVEINIFICCGSSFSFISQRLLCIVDAVNFWFVAGCWCPFLADAMIFVEK